MDRFFPFRSDRVPGGEPPVVLPDGLPEGEVQEEEGEEAGGAGGRHSTAVLGQNWTI